MKDKKEILERIKLFLGSGIYTYIKDIDGYFYNGFIQQLKEDKLIIFRDDVIGEVPIFIRDIDKMTYSKRFSFKREDSK